MVAEPPRFCRPEAFDLFAEQVARLGERDALWKAAVAISMHELTEVDVGEVDAKLQALADRARSRVASGQHQALLAQGHEVLFAEERYTGNSKDYYNPHNSYLPRLLETREGLPITLCLLYKTVMERIGLKTDGVNAPGHFLASVEVDGETMMVDPFSGGRVMTREDAFQRVEQVMEARVPRDDRVLPVAEPQEWLERMLRNLQAIFNHAGREDDLAAMRELDQLLT